MQSFHQNHPSLPFLLFNALDFFSGYIGGKGYRTAGGGSNYQCLPKDPQFGKIKAGTQSNSFMYGTEFETFVGCPFPQSMHNLDALCAVCHVSGKTTQLMIPAWKACPAGWTQEYTGYLMAERHTHQASTFICVDEKPTAAIGSKENKDGALLYFVEARCGSLPCPHYHEGYELTCVVCTK